MISDTTRRLDRRACQRWDELRYLVLMWDRLNRGAAVEAGIPYRHYLVLLSVKASPQSCVSLLDLAGRLQLSRSATNKLVARMVKDGLLGRELLGAGEVIRTTAYGERALDDISSRLRPWVDTLAPSLRTVLSSLVTGPLEPNAAHAQDAVSSATPTYRERIVPDPTDTLLLEILRLAAVS